MPRQETTAAMAWLRGQSALIDTRQSVSPAAEESASAIQVEAWLQRRGVKYSPATGIPMHLIDVKRSRQNQARRDPIVTESVDRFVAALRAGRTFPPIVVYAIGSKLVIVDGNNRHEAAARARLEYIHGIIIDEETDGDLIQLLTVEANASHGVTPPLEWRIRQAFHLNSIGHPDDLAAEAAGITLTQLRNARAQQQAEQRAKQLRIANFSDISGTAKQLLNVIKNEPVFYAAGKLAADARLTTEQVRDVCRAVKSGKSEPEQLAIVAEQQKLLVAENAAAKAVNKRVNSPKNALVAGIGLMINLNTNSLIGQIRTLHDRDAIKKRLDEAVEKILEIQMAMEEELKDMEEEE